MMDKKTIFSKTGKGVLEVKNKSGKLPKDLTRVLSLIDGKSPMVDLLEKSGLSDADMEKAITQLTTGGFIKEFGNTSGASTGGGAGSAYVDDLDFTSSLSSGKSVYQNAQSEWRQRESADRLKAEEEEKRKREEAERLKKDQAQRHGREESSRMAAVEAERKAKEAAALKMREEAERKAKLQAVAMEQTQRDMQKILEAERKAFEQAELKRQQEEQKKGQEEAARRAKEDAERKRIEEEGRRRKEQEEAEKRARDEAERKRREEEERKRKEREDAERRVREEAERKRRAEQEEARRREEEERKRKEEMERKRREEEERKRREEDERKRREEEERKRREEEERKRKEEEERRKREEEERRVREEVERKLKEEEERRRKEEEERRRQEEEDRRRREEELRKLREEEERKRKEAEDAERKRKEEEERLRLEAEVARRLRREEEDRRRQEEDERRRREDEEMRGADGDGRAEEERRREEEDRRRRDEEELRQKEDAERRQREEAEARRREEEDRRRADADRQAREDAERLRQEDDRRRREDEERTRTRTRESASSDLGQIDLSGLAGLQVPPPSTKADLPTFDLSGLRAMETQVAAEFDKQQEDLRRREEEEERQREEAEQARMAMERAEREEHARLESARREAEDRERRILMERERAEREEGERKRKEEKEQRIREQEQAKIKAAIERERQEAMRIENERRSREEALVQRRKEQEERDRKRAEVDSLRKTKAVKTPLERLKPLVLGVGILAAVVLGGIQLAPLNSYIPAIEKLASDHIKEPVSIGSVKLSVFSGIVLNLDDVKLGATQDVKIGKVSLATDFGSLFGETKVIKTLQAESVNVAEEVLQRLPKWKDAAVADTHVQVGRVLLNSVKLETQAMQVPSFDVQLQMLPDGTIRGGSVNTTDGKLRMEFTPKGSDVEIAVTATKGWKLPLGPQIEVTDLTARAIASHSQIRVESFEAFLYGGVAKGSALINWGGPWSIEGDVSTERVGMQELIATFSREAKATGQLESKFRYAMVAAGLGKLFESPKVDGTFTLRKGDLDGVDLVRALQGGGRGVVQGGATRFEEISGSFSLANDRFQYRGLKLASGLLSASGGFEVTPARDVTGRIFVELRSQAAQIQGNYDLDGSLKAIMLRPR
ncbi:MAG: hypothetical protein ACKVP2_09275 [Burkholderiales bacterium]